MSQNHRSFSIIQKVYDQAREIQENLPVFLTQEYESDYEVIVVNETSTDDTDDVLKLLKQEYPRLYTTFLPRPDRRTSRPKMAYSIGIKAAKYDWAIITSIDHKPAASDILSAINQTMAEEAEIHLGYMVKKGLRLQSLSSLEEAKKLIRKAERLKADGHRGKRMKYLRGKYDFLIVRKEQAHDVLKYFELKLSRTSLLTTRISILWNNFLQKGSTTLLVTT